MEVAVNDGFNMSRSNSGMAGPSQTPTQDPLRMPPQTQIVPNQQSHFHTAFPMPSTTTAPSLSRSSSQMEGPERVRGAKELVRLLRAITRFHFQATERWEEDEPLGNRATKAAVLYANVNYPLLKEQYPAWTDRVKQIQRYRQPLIAASL